MSTAVVGTGRPRACAQELGPGWILVHRSGATLSDGLGGSLVFASEEEAFGFAQTYLCDVEDFELQTWLGASG